MQPNQYSLSWLESHAKVVDEVMYVRAHHEFSNFLSRILVMTCNSFIQICTILKRSCTAVGTALRRCHPQKRRRKEDSSLYIGIWAPILHKCVSVASLTMPELPLLYCHRTPALHPGMHLHHFSMEPTIEAK